MIRKTWRLYRKASTPELLHRAIKTAWQGFAGGGAVSVGFTNRTGWINLGIAALSAIGAGVVSFITNLMAAVDELIELKKVTTSREGYEETGE